MSNSTRLTGAALTSAVIKDLRADLSEYGLPMDEYKVDDIWSESIGSDMQPIMSIVFKHPVGGRTITVDNIHPNDNGTILQRSGDVQLR